MKKKIIIVMLLLMLMVPSYFLFIKYKKEFKIDNSSYAFTSNKIVEKLYISDLQSQDSSIDYTLVKDNEQIYSRGTKYYVGQDKKEEIIIDYPLISKDGNRVSNLGDSKKLLTEKFKTSLSFENSVLVDGTLYNQTSLERVDNEKYFLFNIENKVFLNSTKITVHLEKTDKEIPTNSILYFMENEIRYYYLDNGIFKYDIVKGIDLDNEISYFNNKISYQNLLFNLDIVVDEKTEEVIIPPKKPEDTVIIDKPTIDKIEYVKPEVTFEILSTSVYSMKIRIKVEDNARRIETSPTFEFKIDNKTFIRKVCYTSGDFEISGLLPNTKFDLIGYFTYRNEKDKLYKTPIISTTITTKNVDILEPIKLTYNNDELFSNKIKFSNIFLSNEKSDEVLKGIKNSEIMIGKDTFSVPTGLVSKLRKLQSVEYSSPPTLKSNTIYDAKFFFTDIAGNNLVVENSNVKVKTIKQKPSATIEITKTDLTLFKANIGIINDDLVNLENKLYVVTDNENKIVSQSYFINDNILVEDLDINSIYNLSVYGDYDLEDGKGIQYKNLLKSVKVSTKPLSTLGFVHINLSENSISQDSISYNLSINQSRTETKLIELLEEIEVTFKNTNTKETVKKILINGESLNLLKGSIPVQIECANLLSNTNYTIEMNSVIKQGTKKYNIKTLSNIKEFRTLKKPATVEIINRFTSENLIDFDVKISDIDGAITSKRGMLHVRDSSGSLVNYILLDINADFKRLTLNKLNKEETYKFTYTVEEYNIGFNNTTYEQDKVLLEESIKTSVGIYGTVEIESLLKEITSDNLFDISNNKRWKKDGSSVINQKSIDSKNKIIKMSSKNGYATYSYFLPEAKNQNINISFYARNGADSNNQKIYLSNGGGSNKYSLLNELTNDWKKYSFNLLLNSNSYIGFYVDEIANNNTITTLEVKELSVALNSSKTTSDISDSYYDSKYIFRETKLKAGNESMPKPLETGNMTGNSENGYARITNINTNKATDFNYTGNYQTFTVPNNGIYEVELWGAGTGTIDSGRGAYTSGKIELKTNDKIYIYVGQQGKQGTVGNDKTSSIGLGGTATFNGGGAGGNAGGGDYPYSSYTGGNSGGGATDIRIKSGSWNNKDSLRTRIMVAGGGGGHSSEVNYDREKSDAGGLTGQLGGLNSYLKNYPNDVGKRGIGGSQTSGFQLGLGGNGSNSASTRYCSGHHAGGGGYYGGTGGDETGGNCHQTGGGGGSSFISGHMGCFSISNQEKTDVKYVDYEEKTTYMAKLRASIYDTKGELDTKKFYIQIIRDKTLENNFEYNMSLPTMTENMLLNYHIQKNSSYEIRLSVKIRDRLYPINSTFFTTDEEIRTIKTPSDFFEIHSTGKYLVAEDLDFRNLNRTYWNWFSGKIDFQGHKVLLDVDGSANELIYNVASNGKLENMDVHYYLNNPNAKSGYHGLFYDFRGKVTNLKITVEESTNVPNVNFCLMAYVNRGTIENFVINNKAGLSGQRWTSLGMMHNFGTLKNGYAYGANINGSFPTTYPQESKRIGALAGYAGENSIIENVFSLIGIDGLSNLETENYQIDNRIGSLVGEHNRGILSNAYSYTSGKNRVLTRDANIGNYSNVSSKNLYYLSDEIFNPIYSLKVSKLALKDKDFQNIINKDKKFNIDNFVPFGYFPQIIWPISMPNQEYLSLPTIDDGDLIDITNVKETNIDGSITTAVLMVNNPNNEKIVSVGIKDINTVEVLNQVDNGGKTTLTIKLSNPIKYVSKYNVKSITAKSAYGKDYTRDYKDNERVLAIDMYREINNEQDWLNIKTFPTENFILKKDLDFYNMPVNRFQINSVQGILNGNNFTVKNIEINSGQGLINELRGTLKNINVQNIVRKNENLHDRFALVGQAYTSSVIDNVHVKDTIVLSYNRMGGLVGYGDGVIIRNSSVSNIKNQNLTGQVDVKVGGIIGETHNSTIENCYVQGLSFNLEDAKVVFASGGISGYSGSGNISNVYAVGEIITNSQETGGIVGRNSAVIKNAYSNVDIVSKSDYIGGIAGNTLNSNISNTLSVGSLYSYLQSDNLKRIAGNLGITNNNYAWNEQHINGKISADSNGEELLSKELLSDKLSYEQMINLGIDFTYDDLIDGKLPKLKNSNGNTLLPFQVDNFLKNYSFEVLSIETYKTISNVSVLLSINNPNNYPIKNVVVDNMIGEVKKNSTLNGITYIEIFLTPEKAFDSYRLSKIIYQVDGTEKTYNTDVKIDAQFYKDIEKFEDWQKISDTFAENYRLIADIDFTGKINTNHNVLFNRLEGTGTTKKVLKNLDLKVSGNDQAFIKSINSHINNIEFNNITITNTSANNVSRNALILYAFGSFENIDFKMINLNFSKSNYAAPIAFDRTTDIRNINLNNITVTGREFTAGFISRSTNKAITNINFTDIDVNGTGSYVAGLIANSDYFWTTAVFHLTGKNVKVVGTGSYVGGVFGYGGGNYIDLDNATVTGNGNYVGGVAGQYHSGDGKNLIIKNSVIHGKGNYIGGITGYSYNISYSYVLDSKVYGDLESSTYIGGIAGNGGYTIYNSGVIRTLVESKGNYVGGIKGILSYSTVHSSYVLDSTIKGNNYVGGIAGGHNSVTNTISRCMSNSNVTATNIGAGGIIGYAANQLTDDASNKIYLYHNIVTGTVSAKNITGGLVGRMDKAPFKNHMYSNIVAANVNTTSVDGVPYVVIGSSDYFSSGIKDIKVYNNVTKNGATVTVVDGLLPESFITLDELKIQKTYTDLGFSSYYKFEKLAEGFFPYLKNQLSGYFGYFPLPKENTKIKSASMYARKRMQLEPSALHLLPTFDIYTSDINAFNIEFLSPDPLTQIDVNGIKFNIDKKVYTFTYDFIKDIKITLSDGINKKSYTYNGKTLQNKIYVNEDKFYYIDDFKLSSNTNIKANEVVNIYENKLLKKDGTILALENNEVLDKKENEFYLRTTIRPLYSFDYNELKINTYYNYSTLNKEEINNQIFVKNGNIEFISGGTNSFKQSIVLDNYNNNNYLVMLSKDGNIFNLKDKITFPNNFNNSKIIAMSNNVNVNSYLIGVIYENNTVIVFDYRNGKTIFTNYKNSDNLVEFYINSLKQNKNEEKEISIKNSYVESNELIQKLEKTSIEEYLNEENSTETKKYISVYNDTKKTYDVYDISSIVIDQKTDVKTLNKSINDTINLSASLSTQYKVKKEANRSFKNIIGSIGIFSLILVIIMYLIIILGKNIKEKKA
ncbi:MAG: glycine rich domain-containing protein [Bacilli bacterium]